MKTLNILLIIMLIVFLAIMFDIYKYYHNEYVPARVYTRKMYPFELFEVLCFAALAYSLMQLLKRRYTAGTYVAFLAIILGSAFFYFL